MFPCSNRTREKRRNENKEGIKNLYIIFIHHWATSEIQTSVISSKSVQRLKNQKKKKLSPNLKCECHISMSAPRVVWWWWWYTYIIIRLYHLAKIYCI